MAEFLNRIRKRIAQNLPGGAKQLLAKLDELDKAIQERLKNQPQLASGHNPDNAPKPQFGDTSPTSPSGGAPNTGAALKLPAGLTQEAFDNASTVLRKRLKETAPYGDLGDDIFVQGGRAAGKTTGDIDFGIRVSAEKFNELIEKRLKTLTPGSDTWQTLMVAKERGRIFAGEIGLSGVRKEIQRLLGIETDLSVILKGGLFDKPPFIPIP